MVNEPIEQLIAALAGGAGEITSQEAGAAEFIAELIRLVGCDGVTGEVDSDKTRDILERIKNDPNALRGLQETLLNYSQRLGRGGRERKNNASHHPRDEAQVEANGGRPLSHTVFRKELSKAIKQVGELTEFTEALTTTYRPYLHTSMLAYPKGLAERWNAKADVPTITSEGAIEMKPRAVDMLSVEAVLAALAVLRRAFEDEAQAAKGEPMKGALTAQQSLFWGIYLTVRNLDCAPKDPEPLARVTRHIAAAAHYIIAGSERSDAGSLRWGDDTHSWLLNIIRSEIG